MEIGRDGNKENISPDTLIKQYLKIKKERQLLFFQKAPRVQFYF
jgi:hypothetical protein